MYVYNTKHISRMISFCLQILTYNTKVTKLVSSIYLQRLAPVLLILVFFLRRKITVNVIFWGQVRDMGFMLKLLRLKNGGLLCAWSISFSCWRPPYPPPPSPAPIQAPYHTHIPTQRMKHYAILYIYCMYAGKLSKISTFSYYTKK